MPNSSRGAFPVSDGVMLRHHVMVRGDDQVVVMVVLVTLVHVAVTLHLTLAEVGHRWEQLVTGLRGRRKLHLYWALIDCATYMEYELKIVLKFLQW